MDKASHNRFLGRQGIRALWLLSMAFGLTLAVETLFADPQCYPGAPGSGSMGCHVQESVDFCETADLEGYCGFVCAAFSAPYLGVVGCNDGEDHDTIICRCGYNELE